MAITQTKLLQFLRGKIVATREAAITGLKGITFAADAKFDGTIVVARYKATEGEGEVAKTVVKSVFGLYHEADATAGTPSGVTIFDNIDSVNQTIKDLQKELDDTQAGAGLDADGSYVKDTAATYISGASTLADADSKLDTAIKNVQSEVDTTQTSAGLKADGTYSANTADNYISDATSLTNADDKLDAAIYALQGEVDTTQTGAGLEDDGTYAANTGATYIKEATSLKDADNKLDAALKAVEDKVTANEVASADKTVTVTTSATGTDLAVNIDGKTIVKDATAGTLKADLTVAKLTDAEVTALADNNVKEAYKLIYATDATKTAIGDVVKVYKDSSLIEVYLGSSADTINATTGEITKETATDPQSLNFKYQLADGTYSLVKIDVSKFLTQSEFKDGLQVSDAGEVSVKKDANSEAFLSVSADGVKISGIQDAIDAAATTVVGATANKNVTVTGAEQEDGHTEYTFTETSLTPTADKNYVKASNTVAANLEALDTQVKANADAAAQDKLTAMTVNGVDATITLATDGTSVAVTIEGDNTKVSSEYEAITYPAAFTKAQAIDNTDNVDAAFKKVETTVSGLTQEVLDNEKTTEEAIEAICTAAGIGYNEAAGTVIGYNTDANSASTYIKTASSLADADLKLDAAIKAVADSASAAHTVVDAAEGNTETLGAHITDNSATKAASDPTTYSVDVNFDFGEITF